jgi:hypothetical protein
VVGGWRLAVGGWRLAVEVILESQKYKYFQFFFFPNFQIALSFPP